MSQRLQIIISSIIADFFKLRCILSTKKVEEYIITAIVFYDLEETQTKIEKFIKVLLAAERIYEFDNPTSYHEIVKSRGCKSIEEMMAEIYSRKLIKS